MPLLPPACTADCHEAKTRPIPIIDPRCVSEAPNLPPLCFFSHHFALPVILLAVMLLPCKDKET